MSFVTNKVSFIKVTSHEITSKSLQQWAGTPRAPTRLWSRGSLSRPTRPEGRIRGRRRRRWEDTGRWGLWRRTNCVWSCELWTSRLGTTPDNTSHSQLDSVRGMLVSSYICQCCVEQFTPDNTRKSVTRNHVWRLAQHVPTCSNIDDSRNTLIMTQSW